MFLRNKSTKLGEPKIALPLSIDERKRHSSDWKVWLHEFENKDSSFLEFQNSLENLAPKYFSISFLIGV
jgi:hypothetical protein